MTPTVADALRAAARLLDESGSETPRLDAEVLLGHVLGVARTTLLAEPEAVVSEAQAATFAQLVERRGSGEPVSYIRGLKEFYSLALTVDARALIPRPETELLVDLALEQLSGRLTSAPRTPGVPIRAWDVGTGSGAIAVALAVECRRRGYGGDVRVRATDVSGVALGLAVENAVAHGVADLIDFAVGDLTHAGTSEPVDVLLANLPYVPTDVIPTLPVAAQFEPVLALDGGRDGLDVIRRLLGGLPAALVPDGVALLELGADQRDAMSEAVGATLRGWRVAYHADLAGLPRVVELTGPAVP